MLRFVTKSVSWPIISMYFISTYRTQLFQGFIKLKTLGWGKLLAQIVTKSVFCPIISMYFISTYRTQLFQGFIKI